MTGDPMPTWRSAAACTHANDDACPACDFDLYYARTYKDCPWRLRSTQ